MQNVDQHPLKKTFLRTAEKTVSFLGLGFSIYALWYLFQNVVNFYLQIRQPIGGDYYNSLTYALHFADHLPFPPTGWLSFWHEGRPVIGGYPTFVFYLMYPLFKFFEPALAMEIFSIGTQFLLLVSSFLLFRYVSKSSTFALIAASALYVTKATYYQLFAEGLVVSATMQFLLPLTLLFLYRFLSKRKLRDFVFSALLAGISLLMHPAMGMLTVILPAVTLLIIHDLLFKKRLTAIIQSFNFTAIATLVGSMTIYAMFVQMNTGGGSGPCDSPQCWGIYPQQFITWFHWSTPVLVAILGISALIVLIIRRNKSLVLSFIVPIVPICILSSYLIAAHLHLIDTFASAIFPRRIFWAINILLLVFGATCYQIIAKSFGKISAYTMALVSCSIIAATLLFYPGVLTFDPSNLTAYPAVVPDNIYQFATEKYKNGDHEQFLPGWVHDLAKSETNYRMDSLNQQVNHWWNTIYKMPAVRGYSNNPTGVNADFLYYYQVGTAENKPQDDLELVKFRTLFLLDHYATLLYEDSIRNFGTSQ
ncbi:MAG: glycosyltransferase family 39 protein, partial [Patescibacteria group bacterium]